MRQRRDRIHSHRAPQAAEASWATCEGPNTVPVGRHGFALFHASRDRANVLENSAQHQPGRLRQSRPTFALRMFDFRGRHQKARRSRSVGQEEIAGGARQLNVQLVLRRVQCLIISISFVFNALIIINKTSSYSISAQSFLLQVLLPPVIHRNFSGFCFK